MSSSAQFHVDPAYASLIREIGLDADLVFTDPRIQVWRSLSDRENARLDYATTSLHVKRYPPSAGFMAAQEVEGYRLLVEAGVPAAPIIADGCRADGSSFVILQDLSGYTPADKLLAQGFAFDDLLNITADLAAKLHSHRLHHRDLYLCHFMVKPGYEAKLIDMARVARLANPLTRRRWIVKDLGQFWYSTLEHTVTDEQRIAWLKRYCDSRKISMAGLTGPIRRRASAIGRHDKVLREKQPGRNVSIDS